MVEFIKKLGMAVFEKKIASLDDFEVKLLKEKCTVVVITPERTLKWGSFENALVFSGMVSRINNETKAEYREVCFDDSPDSRQTRRNRAELLFMAERRGEELKRLIPDLIIRVMYLDGKPMSVAERANIRAQAERMNISI
ncbi:hypothetical protein HY839_03195 [Candidatus Azambacteria bacterium]|nr:hypothetical protein [Candidatus Azambacteria bacterium]